MGVTSWMIQTSNLIDVMHINPECKRMMMRLVCTTAFCVISLFVSAAEVVINDPDAFLEMEHDLSMEYETPHTKWAKPYTGGNLRVIFFVSWYQGSTDGREIIELMQRFDIAADAAYFVNGHLLGDNNPRWYRDQDLGTKRVLRLLQKPYDVIFVNQLMLDKLPNIVRDKIRNAVSNGAGLVMVGENLDMPFDGAKPITADASFEVPGRLFALGKGRIALLPSRKKLEFRLGWKTEFDYQMAEQGRALLWAGDRIPHTSLTLKLTKTDIPWEELPYEIVSVAWNHTIPTGELRVFVRRSDGDKHLVGASEMSSAGTAQFKLPVLRAGEYQVEAFAMTPTGIENWVTAQFTISTNRVFRAVELDRDWGEIGETLSGKVILSNHFKPEDRLEIRILDKNNRILLRQKSADIQASEIPFSFAIESWMPMLLRTEAVVLRNGREVEAASTYSRVTKRHRNQFNFMIWNIPSGDLAPYGTESLAHYGATAILQGGDPPLYLSACDLAWVPYAESFRASSHTTTAMLDPATGVLKNGCVWDEECMENRVKENVERRRKSREHGVFAYSLGDENAVRASCLSEHCLKAYRRYLREIYSDIQALNREWDSNYASFEGIELLRDGDLPAADAPDWFKVYFAERTQLHRTDDEGGGERQIQLGDINDEMRALQAGNFARWYDRQAFQNHSYVQWCKRYVNAFRELDPQSLTGFEGTDSFSIRRLTTRSRQGGDLDAFVREMEYFGPYPGPANEVVRSIAPPQFPTGNWIGYDMDADVLLDRFWDQVTNGMNTVQWWRWDNLDGYHGFLAPTLAPFDDSREMLQDTQVVRDGLGTLLMDCRMVDDGIAMLYSMPSTYIAHFDGNRTYSNYERDHNLWHESIHNCGLQFRYVTDRMLRLGEFDASRYKVLILPSAFALGDKEADVIREFVSNGGTVIADIRTGMYDEHCKPRKQGVLDDVFGIKRTGKRDAEYLDRLSIDGEISGRKISMRWGNWHGVAIDPQMMADPAVAVTTGKALGSGYPIHYWTGLNDPVCIVNPFGKGRAIYLNFPIYNAPIQSLLSDLFAAAGVMPMIQIWQPEGKPVTGVEITRWTNGEYELLALFGAYNGHLRVQLQQTVFINDIKSHRSYGNVSDFETLLRPHRAEVFALLPKEIPKPAIELDKYEVRPGEIVQALIAVPNALGKHALRIEAAMPDGHPAPWLERKLIVDRQPVKIPLPFAHNDPIGVWKIRLVDLLTDNGPLIELSLVED